MPEKKPEEIRRERRVLTLFTDSEYAKLKAEAEASDISISEFIRRELRDYLA